MPNNSSAGSEILSRLQQAPTIHPASASLFTDWSLEPGDVVTVKSDEEAYMVPIYTMLMEWTGSSKVEISSSGNQKREPLPALTRRDYATRSAINGMRQKMEDQEEINQQYQHWRTETNQQLTSVYKITGVKLDRYGRPIYQQAKDAQGNPLWETDEQGNPVYDTDLQGNIIYEMDEHGNYVLDEHGNKIPRKKPVYVLDEAGNPVPVYDPDSTGSISSSITQTAQSLNILYEQTGGVTEKFDPEKQYHAGDYVLSPNGVSCRFKVDHLGPWSNDDVVFVPNLQTQITTNATEISNRVTQTSLTQTLGSYITQNAYSVSIGAFLDDNGKVSAAKIVTEINAQDKTSKVIISADMVELDGLVTVSDLFSEGGAYVQDTIHVGGLHVYEDVSIDGNITTSTDSELTLGIIECTSLTATDSMYIGDTEITESFFTDSLTNASVANNILTITKADGTTINFSKATTLNTSDTFTVNGARVTAGWSGGTYTVVATQTNYNTTTEEDETTVVGTASTTIGISSSSWNSPASETVTADTNHPHGVKYTIAPSINLGYQVTQETGPGSTETIMVDIPDRTGLSISAADITSVYEAGRSAGLGALTWDVTSWDYDDTNDVYQCSVRTWDGTSVIDTEYVSLPSLKTVVTNPTTKKSSWWNASTNKYVIPGTSIYAQAYLTTDSSSEHDVTTVVGKGSDIVIDPTEAVTAGQNSVTIAEPPVWNDSTVTGHENTLQVSTSGRGTEDVKYWSVSASSLTLTKGSLTKATVSGSTVDYAGSYRISRSGGGIVSVKGVQTSIYASVTALTLALELAEPTVSHSWDSTNHVYTYEKSASLTVDNAANVLTRNVTTGLTLTPTEAINYGFDVCHDSIGLSVSTQTLAASTRTLAAGTSLTIYPKAKDSATASSASNITTAGITITAEAATVSGDVDVTGPTWSNNGTANNTNTATFSPASGNGDPANVQLTMTNTITAMNWNSSTHVYAIGATGSVKDGDSIERLKVVGSNSLTPTDAINYGKTLVNVTSIDKVSNSLVYDKNNDTVTADIIVSLSNGTSKTFQNVDLSEAYVAGKYDKESVYYQYFEVELSDGDDFTTTKDEDDEGNLLRVYVGDINDEGKDDYVEYIYAYNHFSSSNNVAVYGSSSVYSSSPIGYLYPNSALTVIMKDESTDRWYYIKYGNYYGYVRSEDVSRSPIASKPIRTDGVWAQAPSGTTPIEDPIYTYTGTIKESTALRASASGTSTSIMTLSANTSVLCDTDISTITDGNTWIGVKTKGSNPQEGYVQAKYFKEFNSGSTPEYQLTSFSVTGVYHETTGSTTTKYIKMKLYGKSNFVEYASSATYSAQYQAMTTVNRTSQYLATTYSGSYHAWHNASTWGTGDMYFKVRIKLNYSNGTDSYSEEILVPVTSRGSNTYNNI